jgi:hypothetical protein
VRVQRKIFIGAILALVLLPAALLVRRTVRSGTGKQRN